MKNLRPVGILKKKYELLKRWIVYAMLILILVVVYFGELLGPLRDTLLPAAVVSIIAIIYDTLENLEKGTTSTQLREYPSIAEALPDLCEVVSKDKDKTLVEIISSTGGTTASSILPAIIRSSKANQIEIHLRLINPNSTYANTFPAHWIDETQLVIERLKNELTGNRIYFFIYLYDFIPCLHGILINKSHLMIGFFGWEHYSGRLQLAGAERPHRFITKKEIQYHYYFDLFSDWFEHSPSKLIYSYPDVSKSST